MLRDLEENSVKLMDVPNAHILILGQSGQGKTYLSCREIEAEYEAGKKVLILDFAGSFSNKEMKKNCFKYHAEVNVMDITKAHFAWLCNYRKQDIFVAELSDVLLDCWNIKSYIQRKLLREAVASCVEKYGQWNITQFYKVLEVMLEQRMEMGNSETYQNIERLLTRVEPYLSICKLYIKNEQVVTRVSPNIVVMQISEHPELEKKFLINIFLGLLWKERKQEEYNRHCDVIFLDEVQHVSLHENSSLANMLREGRKTELKVIMATQFIDSYEKNELATLQQAGHYILFRPVPKACRFVAEFVDNENVSLWIRVLSKLDVGEAVVVGRYILNEGTIVNEKPLICKA